MAIARQFVRERAHVAGALHIVLPAQRIDADAATPEIAGRHREIGDGHDRRRALAVFGDAEAVIDRRVAAGRVKPRRAAHADRRGNAGVFLGRLGTVALLGNEGRPVLIFVPVAAFAHEFFVDETFRDDHMRQRRDDRDIGSGAQGQMIRPPRYAASAPARAARIDDDQLGALAQPLLDLRADHGMRVGRIAADDQNDVGLVDRVEILRAGRRAEGLARGHSRSANGKRARRCRRYYCRSRRGSASARDRFPRSCSATR